MVQYVFTPWRDRRELLAVRRQFYPDADSMTMPAAAAAAGQRAAVARVAVWMQRGHCPHMVESTALLVAALLGEDEATRPFLDPTPNPTPNPTPTPTTTTIPPHRAYAARAAYAAAFSRFVTCRAAVRGYVERMDTKETDEDTEGADGVDHGLARLAARWGEARGLALETLPLAKDEEEEDDDEKDVTHGSRARRRALRCLRLARSLLEAATKTKTKAAQATTDGGPNGTAGGWTLETVDLDAVRATLEQERLELYKLEEEEEGEKEEDGGQKENDDDERRQDSAGGDENADGDVVMAEPDLEPEPEPELPSGRPRWTRFEGEWKPRPIGVVFKRFAAFTPIRNMQIQSIPMWVGSSNNYAYLVVDDKSKDAVIIDPAHPEEVVPVLQKAIQAGQINLTAIVNTHHHWDHAGGNEKVVGSVSIHLVTSYTVHGPPLTMQRTLLNRPDLPVIGGRKCAGVTRTPPHGEGFQLGQAVAVTGLHTPCHTQDSICWFVQDGADRVVFTGDTLFHGGCGKFFEGSAAEMHKALNVTLAGLPDDTRVFPGHEYTKSNVKFALSVLPSEPVKKLQEFAATHAETQGRFTIGDEKVGFLLNGGMNPISSLTIQQHNVFMRVTDPAIQKATGETEPVAVMAKLRELKNNF
ncbi:Beta-lactamase-like protein [Niveomyces insectorum RCEF 264]|uniref:hydroxyacylglutathione hydrolase n=1 Tax=Niveomyces insectorum RCEF 264 TaxID=1081102 RepID=A0A167TBU1_9HYPO|nr:Beta-lactamase-like protein [Niveomyces insectorum RCEF 264]